jgi:hypothetical protein
MDRRGIKFAKRGKIVMPSSEQVSEGRKEKIVFVRGLLKETPKLRATDIYVAVKTKFGSGIDGIMVRKLKQEVDPSYVGKRRRTTGRVFPDALDGTGRLPGEIDLKRRVDVNTMYFSFRKVGATDSQARAAVLDATGIRPLVFEFKKEQLEQAQEDLSKYRLACFNLNKKGEIVRVNPVRVTVQEKRGRKKESERAPQQN